MGEKQELIKKMLEMQKHFMEYEHKHGVKPDEYYAPPEDHELATYREEYDRLAARVLEIAHEEQGSHR